MEKIKKGLKYLGLTLLFIYGSFMALGFFIYGISSLNIKIQFESVKNSPAYVGYIGKTISPKIDFVMYGSRDDDNIKQVEYYYLRPTNIPGVSNRFIISKTKIKQGTEMVIIDVLQPKSFLMYSSADLVIRIKNQEFNKPIKLSIYYYNSDLFHLDASN